MVDAPEKIWVQKTPSQFFATDIEISNWTKYLRSDIAERQIAELQAERDKARARVVAAWNAFAGHVADDYAETIDVAVVVGGDLDEQISVLTEQRNDAEAEKARLRALPLKDEVERVVESFADACGHFDGHVKDDDNVSLALRHIKARQLRAARSLLSRLRAGEQEGWRTECATEGCDKPATVHFERGGIGSYYCHGCYMRIQALPAAPKQGEAK